MRRILLAFMTTVTAVVALFGYRTSTAHPVSVATTTVAAGTSGSATASGSTTPVSPTPTSSSSAPTAAATTAAKTVTGDVAQTRWGPVQVQITVASGEVTAASAVQVPSGNPRDTEINGVAVPILTQETVQAQSAQIDGVSGATVTSDGYVTSLQSALDRAGL